MKKILLIFFVFIEIVWVSNEHSVERKSAWNNYINNPCDENAKKVHDVYGGDTDKGLRILKREIGKGSLSSLELAIRLELSKTSGLDGEAAITIPYFISYGARVNLKGYMNILESLGITECLHIDPMGMEYVDGENRQKMYDEYREKYEQFKKLQKSPLQEECLQYLATSLKDMNSLRIGVQEQPQCREDNRLQSKVLFQKQNENFVTVNESEKPLEWHIAFDGRYLGLLGDKVVKINNRFKGFTGWCSVPHYRPLVLVSRKNFKDPEKWKPFIPKENELQAILPHLHRKISQIKYRQKDVKLLKSYKSSGQKKLIQVGFDLKGESCEGKSEAWCSNYWFYTDAYKIRLIGTNLELIDAGDYDDNGLSEVLFWHGGYNEDGYKLLYNNFEKSVERYESYH